MRHLKYCVGSVLAGAVLAGCAQDAQKRGPTAVDRQIPAPKPAPAPPPARNEPLDPALQAAARAEIGSALSSKDDFVRAHAIEATQNTLKEGGRAVYLKGLTDPHAQVRFNSAIAAGQLGLADAKPQLLQMVNDRAAIVRIAVRFALHRLGEAGYTKDLEQTARDPVWQVRANTALVLGLLGEPTAVRVLRPMQRDPEAAVRIQVAEALWRLGDADGLKSLVSAAQSGYPDDQMIALIGLAAPKDARVMGHLRSSLTADYPEVGLVAARAMGALGSDAGYAVAAEGARSPDARRRLLAAQALGAIGRSDAQSMLGALLKDRASEDVRLSAAQAILQLKS